MAVYICIGGFSRDTSNLDKLRELTEKLGNTADAITSRLDLNGRHISDNDNGQ